MRKNGLPPGPGFGLARSGHKPARPKPGPQEPIGQQVLSSITQRTYMVQWEGQSFKSIFLSISTTCRVWFQEGGTGSGTDLAPYHTTLCQYNLLCFILHLCADGVPHLHLSY